MKFDVVSPNNEKVAHITYLPSTDSWTMYINGSPNELPIALANYKNRGILEPPEDFIRMFLADRVFPPDRQNIAQILNDMGLDHWSIEGQLQVTQGRCDRDDFLIVPVGD